MHLFWKERKASLIDDIDESIDDDTKDEIWDDCENDIDSWDK
jgi:hypothetical protein